MKLFQGDVRAMIGCWTCPRITSVYTMEKMAEGSWRSRSPKYKFQGPLNTLSWSNGFCGERGKRGGLVGKGKGPINIFLMKFFWDLYMQLFPLGKDQKAHFPSSVWCNESWEPSPPSICLDHIIARDTCHFFHVLPLKLAPTCFIKQCGASRTQESECKFVFLVYQLKYLEFGDL